MKHAPLAARVLAACLMLAVGAAALLPVGAHASTGTSLPTPPPMPVAAASDLVLDAMPISEDSAPGEVVIVVPLRYKGVPARMGGLGFLEIWPVIGDPAATPFELSSGNMVKTLMDVESTTIDGRPVDYIRFPMQLKSDTLNGQYKVSFHARFLHLYQNAAFDTPAETTLDLYFRVGNGATPTPTPKPTPEPAGPQSVPKIIVENFKTDPSQIVAGSQFSLDIQLHNTSEKRTVSNIKCTLDGGDAIVPVSGSNTFYIKSIKADGTYETKLDMFAQPNASPKPHPIKVKMEYEYKADTLLTATSDEQFTVTVKQPVKLVLDEPRVDPMMLMPGDMFNVYMNMFNMGKSTLFNVSVTVEGPMLRPDETFFAGSMGPGESRTYDMMVTYGGAASEQFTPGVGSSGGDEGVTASSGGALLMTDSTSLAAVRAVPMPGVIMPGKTIPPYGEGNPAPLDGTLEYPTGPQECAIVVTYEDEMGEQSELRKPFTLTYNAPISMDGPIGGDGMDPLKGGMPGAVGPDGQPMPEGVPASASAPFLSGLPIVGSLPLLGRIGVLAGLIVLVGGGVTLVLVLAARRRRGRNALD